MTSLFGVGRTGFRLHLARGGAVAAMACLMWLVLVGGSGPASAYPVQQGTLTVTSGTLTPGGTVSLGGGGFAPGGAVSVYVYSTPTLLATTTADPTGAMTVTVVLPSDLPAGSHTLQAVGPAPGGGTNQLSVQFTVGGNPLASTGFPVVTALVLAAVLLVGGGAVLVGLRRRRA
jgi:hypothetical protein